MSKLYCVQNIYSSSGVMREVTVLKETEKQLKINGGNRSQINKSQLGQNLGGFNFEIYTYEPEKAIAQAIEIAKQRVYISEKELQGHKNTLEQLLKLKED